MVNTFLHALFTQSVKKNSSTIPDFSRVSRLKNGGSWGSKTSECSEGPFFNKGTQENSRIIRDEFFNTERESCVKENAFSHFCFRFDENGEFFMKSKKNQGALRSFFKCKEIFSSV